MARAHRFLGSHAIQVPLRKYVITRNLLPGETRWTFSVLMHSCVGGRGEQRERWSSGVCVCPSDYTKGLVPPICFPLSRGAGEEPQLHWGQCQRGPKSSLMARAGALRGQGRWEWVGEGGCGILGEWFCPKISVYLGWKRSSPPMAWPRMLMSQGKGTGSDCVSHRTGNGRSAPRDALIN